MLGVKLHRICTTCLQEKDLECFYTHSTGKYGRRSVCKECCGKDRHDRRVADIDSARAYGRSYYAANAEQLRKAANDNNATIRGKLDNAIGAGLSRKLAKGSRNGRSKFDLLGFTFEEFSASIEKQFEPGMTWDNYGFHGWHIDHKRPLCSFNYSTPDCPQFKEAWALSNLQPLWCVDNWAKGASLAA
jgi:hypothetical protein